MYSILSFKAPDVLVSIVPTIHKDCMFIVGIKSNLESSRVMHTFAPIIGYNWKGVPGAFINPKLIMQILPTIQEEND